MSDMVKVLEDWEGNPMIARLGNVLYWAGCIFAVIIGGGGALIARNDTYNPWGMFLSFAVIAAVVWVIGKTCRYILAGR
jgi:hypothetical protein